MIAIVNVTHSDPLFMGVSTYEVRVNRKVIATFEHRRGDPLEVCLMKASQAVAKAKWGDLKRSLGSGWHTFGDKR